MIAVNSSYHINNMGRTIYNIVLEKKPKIIIEFGVLYGYSTISMALALKKLKFGTIKAYDLWDKYEYNHTTKDNALLNLKKHKVSHLVDLQEMNFYDWIKSPEYFDLLHVDISNDGSIIKILHEKLKDKISAGSVVIFEGGTEERDKIEWMTKYKKQPMCSVKKEVGYRVIDNRFPGLSIIELK